MASWSGGGLDAVAVVDGECVQDGFPGVDPPAGVGSVLPPFGGKSTSTRSSHDRAAVVAAMPLGFPQPKGRIAGPNRGRGKARRRAVSAPAPGLRRRCDAVDLYACRLVVAGTRGAVRCAVAATGTAPLWAAFCVVSL